jgi:hypothetical protein
MVKLGWFVMKQAKAGNGAAQRMEKAWDANHSCPRKHWTRGLPGWGSAPERVRRKKENGGRG